MTRANEETERVRVLAFVEWFLPGEKAGGPVRSLAALMGRLSDSVEFRILTHDRDLDDSNAYDGVRPGLWYAIAGGTCRYLGPRELRPRSVARVMRSTPHDVIYVNTLYSAPFCLYPVLFARLGLVRGRRIIVAPRGQLNPSALAIRRTKKTSYLALIRVACVFRHVEWQATTEAEASAIRRWFGRNARISLAPNMRLVTATPEVRDRGAGPLRAVYLSRISPIKNLHWALQMLAGTEVPLHLDILGPLGDEDYWRRCSALIDALPPHVTVAYGGRVAGARVPELLSRYDVLILPTGNENYGHVIAEALAAGCPPLISDRTPWRGLSEAGVGWDLPLDDPAAFRAVLTELAQEPPERARARRRAAVAYAAAHDADPDVEAASRALFTGVAEPLQFS